MQQRQPSEWVRRFCNLIPQNHRVLDLACGHGRHSRLLAACGHDVLAVDRDTAALESLAGTAGVETRTLDLEQSAEWPFTERFADVVVTN